MIYQLEHIINSSCKDNKSVLTDMKPLSEMNLLFGQVSIDDVVSKPDIDLSNISHTVTNVKIINGLLYGDIQIFKGNQGDCLKAFKNGDIPVNFSVRYDGNRLVGVDAVLIRDPLKVRKLKLNKILNKIDEQRSDSKNIM